MKSLPITGYYGIWLGLAPDDSPLLLHDVGTQDIYALDWEAPGKQGPGLPPWT